MESFLSFLDVTGVLKVSSCKRSAKRRKYGTSVKPYDGWKCENAVLYRPLKLIIGHICPTAADDNGERLDGEVVNLVHIAQSFWYLSNEMLKHSHQLYGVLLSGLYRRTLFTSATQFI